MVYATTYNQQAVNMSLAIKESGSLMKNSYFGWFGYDLFFCMCFKREIGGVRCEIDCGCN